MRRSRLKIILLYFTSQFSVYTKFGVDPLHLTIWASFHADSSEFRSFLFRSDASANDRWNRCLLKSTLPVPLHGYPCHILPESTFELRCAALHAPSLPLLYHFFSKVKAFCCIIENCYKCTKSSRSPRNWPKEHSLTSCVRECCIKAVLLSSGLGTVEDW